MSVPVALLAALCALNPAAFVASVAPMWDGRDFTLRRRLLSGAALVAVPVLIGAMYLAEPVTEWLDLAQESVRVAGGTVLAVAGGRVVLFGPLRPPGFAPGWAESLVPVALPLLVSAELLAVALAAGVDGREPAAIAGIGIGLALAATAVLLPRLERGSAPGIALNAAARLTGALAIVVAAGMIVDGVKDV